MVDLTIGCRCGQFGAKLKNVSPKTGSHVQCHCKDCQAGAHALGAEETLLPRGGSDIFQTIPANLELTKGQDHLACLRLSPKGLMRWYASCCNTPVFNTLGGTKLAFIGVSVPTMQGDGVGKAIGKVIAVVQTKDAPFGTEPLKDYGFNKAGFNVLARHFGALMRGQVKDNPLFEGGAPVVEPRVLSKAERKAATP
ncbi:DUF6151 family protein [uncultured Shimia sp.]|uniref:DUF6151 family protein n=1 Tax=uncultured Shimia sp. TaxID=573152 RepID=UPI0025EDE6A9|nr:DUF6151 family protein [uncultured Shimia sp.]